jgi:hypothetical protein
MSIKIQTILILGLGVLIGYFIGSNAKKKVMTTILGLLCTIKVVLINKHPKLQNIVEMKL